MISPPKQKIWKDLMAYIIKHYERNYKPVENKGPMAMTHLYEESPEVFNNVVITDPCTFYPLTNNGISKRCDIDKDSYVAHIWANTWIDKHWWESPLIWNARYWVIGLMSIYIILWICLYK